jgi:hypothetical protein
VAEATYLTADRKERERERQRERERENERERGKDEGKERDGSLGQNTTPQGIPPGTYFL